VLAYYVVSVTSGYDRSRAGVITVVAPVEGACRPEQLLAGLPHRHRTRGERPAVTNTLDFDLDRHRRLLWTQEVAMHRMHGSRRLDRPQGCVDRLRQHDPPENPVTVPVRPAGLEFVGPDLVNYAMLQ
jgi:hypothetical protein